jgi:sugar phosphate isomerase/epimerase
MTAAARRRLAISNIAWDSSEDDAVAAAILQCGATGVEIAPTKWRDDPLAASPADVAAYRRRWEERGLPIVSLQSLLFGRPDLQLFGGSGTRAAFVDFLRRTIDFAAALGAQRLVFGSPKNRVRGPLSIGEATAAASEVFRELGEHAHARGAVLCIEANPTGYGCDFITTTHEAIEMCRTIDHPGIGVNGDLGGMTMAGEAAATSIEDSARWLAHFHASEPNLAELGSVVDGGSHSDHAAAAAALAGTTYDGWVSVEMRQAGGGGNLAAVERALKRARASY